jgi:putative heme iron utilization protein
MFCLILLLLPTAIAFTVPTKLWHKPQRLIQQQSSVATTKSAALSSAATRLLVAAPAVSATVNGARAANQDEATKDGSATIPLDNIRLNVNEKARTVTSVCTSGTLCTVSAHEGIEGAPFGSFVDYVLDDEGNPVLLMNEMSMHTINIKTAFEQSGVNPKVTLFTQLSASEAAVPGSNSGSIHSSNSGSSKANLQDVSRCSLTGTLEKIDPSTAMDMDAIRMRYSLTHTYADQVMDSPKFAFYRLVPSKIYFVGGFGVLAKWVEPEDYKLAAPDILAKQAPEIVERINRDHGADLQLTAQHLLGVDPPLVKIRVTNVDRLGLDIRVTSQRGSRRNKLQTDEFRIGFRIPVISVEDAKSEILKIFQEAWEKGNGVTWGEEEMPGSNVPIMKIASDGLE